MKKIAIVSRDLNVGGIQRSLSNLLQNIDTKKYEVDCYLYDRKNFFKDKISSDINIIYLKPRWEIIKFIPFVWVKHFSKCKLNQKRYDYAIDFDSFQTDTAIDVLLSNSKSKICFIHQNLLLLKKYEIKYRILYFFAKKKYLFYDKYAAVSKGIIEPFEQLNKMLIQNISVVIPNYIDTKIIFDKAEETCDLKVDNSKYNFVSVGRICVAKGYDLLINYLFELTKYRQDFHFYLIGDGVDRKKLENQIKRLKMNEYVTLLGNQPNPFKYLKLMDGFVMTSRYEGQGMVLWEAKSLGLELFMIKNLEKYNDGLVGHEDLVKALAKAKKKNKIRNNLEEYNINITNNINKLLK